MVATMEMDAPTCSMTTTDERRSADAAAAFAVDPWDETDDVDGISRTVMWTACCCC